MKGASISDRVEAMMRSWVDHGAYSCAGHGIAPPASGASAPQR